MNDERFESESHTDANDTQKLAAKDLSDWEQKRVKRLPGEHDGVI